MKKMKLTINTKGEEKMKKSKLYISLFLTIAMIMSSVAVLYINAAQLAEDDTTATENDNIDVEQEFAPMMANWCNAPLSPVICSVAWLSSYGIDDPEAFKADYVSESNVSKFDIYRDTSDNNALWLGNKNQTIWIRCD